MLFSDDPKIHCGIDPGKDGAIAAILPDAVKFFDLPTLYTGIGKKRDYDVHELASILRRIGPADSLHVMIERQQSMPGQGVATSFQIGLGYGVLLGVLGAMGIPFSTVRPTNWKKVMLADMPPGKESSRAKAKQMFPQAAEDLQLVKHHNRAEALLLADFGRRQLASVR